jgi:hypothetical protein
MNDVEELVAALRVLRGGKGFATYDDALMRRIKALTTVLLSDSGGGDEAVIMRALAQLADVRHSSLAKAARTNRRNTNVLAAEARRLSERGVSDSNIARKVGRSVDTVRRWRRDRG